MPGVLIFGLIAIITLLIISGYNSARYGSGKNVKIRMSNSDSGRSIATGNGHSIGSAAIDICRKIYERSPTEKVSTIQQNIDSIEKLINDYSRRMRQNDIDQCRYYQRQLQQRLYNIKRQEEERKRAKEAEKQEKERKWKEEKKVADAERRRKEREALRIREEKEAQMDARKRHIAQQRRLVSDRMRYDVLSRDGFRCVLCGATQKDGVTLHVDHIIPLAKGGLSEMSNLRTLCERCNLGKGDRLEPAIKNYQEMNDNKKKIISEKTANVESSLSGIVNVDFPLQYKHIDNLVQALQDAKISYKDLRKNGGNLWVASSDRFDFVLSKVTINEKHLQRAASAKAFDGAAGWYIK